jgi:hypothetical protein
MGSKTRVLVMSSVELTPTIVTMNLYGRTWTTAAAAAAALGITTTFVLIAMAEPVFTTAVLVLSAAAAHVRARLTANGAQPPAEIAIVARVALAGIAVGGLLRLLGSVAWDVLAVLAIGAVPLLQEGSRRSTRSSVPHVRPSPSGCAVRFPSTDRRRVHVRDDKCVRIVDSWRISFFDAADIATQATDEPPVPEWNNADHETSSADSLNTKELCRAWSRSYAAIQMSTTPLQLVRISRARQVYLDALEARDPAGMARWLRAEPRADSDLTLHIIASAEPGRTH